jgi:hypothetical protein
MTAVTLSEEAIGKLRPCAEQAELRDAAGCLIGYFTPVKSGEPRVPPPSDAVYRLDELAMPTGVSDLAVNIDHYLYGNSRQVGGDE